LALSVAALLAAGASFFLKDGKPLLQKRTELSFYQWWEAGMDEAVWTALVKGFEAENPRINLRIVRADWEEIRDSFLAANKNEGDERDSAYKGPDIAAIDPSRAGELVAASLLEPLEGVFPVFDTENPQSDENEQADFTVQPEFSTEKRFFVPVVTFIHPLFYNIDLLSDAGYSRPPRTREEFLDYVRKTADVEAGVYGAAISRNVWTDLLSWIWAGGTAPERASGINWKSRQVTETLSFFTKLNEEQLLYPSPLARREEELLDAFAEGKVAMLVLPSQAAADLRAKNPALRFSITSIPQPQSTIGKPVFPLTDWALGLASGSQHKEEALLFMRYLVHPPEELALAALGFSADDSGLPGLLAGGEDGAEELAALEEKLVTKLVALAESADLVSVKSFSDRPDKDLPLLRAAVLELWTGGTMTELKLEG
jgi:multiple sugar transport system substrate-binding protein